MRHVRVSLVFGTALLGCGGGSASPEIDPSAVEPPEPAQPDWTELDAMLAEIDAAWTRDTSAILTPAARPGFDSMSDNGVAVLTPTSPLLMSDVTTHLRARAAHVTNPGVTPYLDGSLVPVGAPSTEEIILPFNAALLVFVTPSGRDPTRVRWISIARP